MPNNNVGTPRPIPILLGDTTRDDVIREIQANVVAAADRNGAC
jgi:hypothetical protein